MRSWFPGYGYFTNCKWIFFLLILNCYAQSVFGAPRYQAAKVPLDAVVRESASLHAEASTEAKRITVLRKDTRVLIRARMGNWFEVETTGGKKTEKGWMDGRLLRVLGPSKKIVKTEEPKTKIPEKKQDEPKAQNKPAKESGRLHLAPFFGMAYGAKLMAHQFRVGTDLFFSKSSNLKWGATLEAGFHELTLFGIGPTLAHQLSWPKWGMTRVVVFAGFPFYFLRANSENDFLWGVRAGAEFWFRPRFLQRNKMGVFLRTGVDVPFIGSQRLRIPVSAVLGLERRF